MRVAVGRIAIVVYGMVAVVVCVRVREKKSAYA